jgi:hypothetical protein
LVCLAFATWCLVDTWVEYAKGQVTYFARLAPLRAVVIPALCLELAIALVLLGAWEACRRRGLGKAAAVHLLFVAGCLVPLGIASVAALHGMPVQWTATVESRLFWPVALLAGAVPALLACLRPQSASRLMRLILLYSCPVLAIVLAQAAYATLRYPDSAYDDGALAAPVSSAPARVRVIWIIFDEMSQTIAFGNRPAGLALPNLDRLRKESLYATAATSPAMVTTVSLPSLIVGEKVAEAMPHGPGDLQVRFGGQSQPVAWSSIPNVFDAARGLGFNTALVGWYHPYGRLLNRSLTRCYWTAGWLPAGVEEPAQPRSLPAAIWERAQLQAAALPLVGRIPGVFPGVYQRRGKMARLRWLDGHAREIVADPAIGLALLHLPVPHPPAINRRALPGFAESGPASYLDSMVLADGELGSLRRAMEDAGLWDRTAVLVSADHGWRTSTWRGNPEWTAEDEAVSHQDTAGVPFLLKLPGQNYEIAYPHPFNTVLTRRLITAILSGAVTDPAALPAFLENGDGSR